MSFTIDVGTKAPEFTLPGADGNEHSLASFNDKQAIIVVFTCNHCPAAIGTQDRIVALQSEYGPKGVQVIAINSNEDDEHTTDSFEHMVERAREQGFNFPYLRDRPQDVAKAYGGQRTPHFFLLDSNQYVVYTGRMDDNPFEDGKQTTSELRTALDQLLAGQRVTVEPTDPIGCNVKWWGKDAHWMPKSLADFD